MDLLISAVRNRHKRFYASKVQQALDQEKESSPIIEALKEINKEPQQITFDQKYFQVIFNNIYSAKYRNQVLSAWNGIQWELGSKPYNIIDDILSTLNLPGVLEKEKYNIYVLLTNICPATDAVTRLVIPKPLRILIDRNQLLYIPLAFFIPKRLLTKEPPENNSNLINDIPAHDDLHMKSNVPFDFVIDGYLYSLSEYFFAKDKEYSRLFVRNQDMPIDVNQAGTRTCLFLLIDVYCVCLDLCFPNDTCIIDNSTGKLFTTIDYASACEKQKFILRNFDMINIPKRMVYSTIIHKMDSNCTSPMSLYTDANL